MKFYLEINNQIKNRFSQEYFEKVIEETIRESRVAIPENSKISLAVVSEKEIKRINRIYRKEDKITDVLSFAYHLRKEKIKSEKENIFGELILCYSYIRKSSEENKITLEREMAYAVSHGMLHCLGFEHGRKMYKIQDEVCERVS